MDTKVSIPEFEATALDAIPGIASTARGTFRTHKTKTLEWRQTQLRKLYWALDDYQPQILAALQQDLRKSSFEALLSEIDWLKKDCMFMLDNLEKYAKDEKLGSPDVPTAYSFMKFRIKKEPLGTVLIIGPYNFPVQLLLAPLIGAIGAGLHGRHQALGADPSVCHGDEGADRDEARHERHPRGQWRHSRDERAHEREVG
jgi:beta-apo-4'-carotenal oxygenase